MKRLLLKITEACPSRCRHCYYHCKPGKSRPMTKEEIRRCIREGDPTECVIITGGEASIHPELVLHAVRESLAFGKVAWLNTNGFWGGDAAFAARYARELRAAGLRRINFSVDGLHQEYIPFDSVLVALRAAKEAGIPIVEVFTALISDEGDNEWDRRSRELLAVLDQEPYIRFDARRGSARVALIGRACSELAAYGPPLSLEEALEDTCWTREGEFGAIKDLCEETWYQVTPECTVELCGAMVFPKNLREARFAEVVCPENVTAHPLISLFQRKGVAGLLRLACERGYEARDRYVSKCDLCQDVLCALRSAFPEVVRAAAL